MVRFINHHDIGKFRHAAEPLGEIPLAAEVGVVEHGEVAEIRVSSHAAYMWEPPAQVWIPDCFPRGLGGKQHDSLAFVQNKPLDQHQADESLAETNAVTEEGATMPACDLHHRPVGLLLVPVEIPEHFGLALVPFGRGELMATEEFLQRLGVDVERREGVCMSFYRAQNAFGYFARIVPMIFKPLLQLAYFASALYLNVQLDIVCQSWFCEVA